MDHLCNQSLNYSGFFRFSLVSLNLYMMTSLTKPWIVTSSLSAACKKATECVCLYSKVKPSPLFWRTLYSRKTAVGEINQLLLVALLAAAIVSTVLGVLTIGRLINGTDFSSQHSPESVYKAWGFCKLAISMMMLFK